MGWIKTRDRVAGGTDMTEHGDTHTCNNVMMGPSLPSLSVLPVWTHNCLRSCTMKGSEAAKDPAPLFVIRHRKPDVKNLQLVMRWGAHLEADYELWVRLSCIVSSGPPRNRTRDCLKIIIN